MATISEAAIENNTEIHNNHVITFGGKELILNNKNYQIYLRHLEFVGPYEREYEKRKRGESFDSNVIREYEYMLDWDFLTEFEEKWLLGYFDYDDSCDYDNSCDYNELDDKPNFYTFDPRFGKQSKNTRPALPQQGFFRKLPNSVRSNHRDRFNRLRAHGNPEFISNRSLIEEAKIRKKYVNGIKKSNKTKNKMRLKIDRDEF